MQPLENPAETPDWIFFHCESCGKKYKARAVCEFCGGPLTVAAPREETPVLIPLPDEESPMAPSPSEPEYEELILNDPAEAPSPFREARSSSKKVPVLIGIGVVVVLAVVAYLMFGLPF